MQTLKFRAWDNVKKKMYDWEDISIDSYGVFTSNDYEKDENADYVLNNDAVLMQYTGLKDKNGKEIYEGDIVTLGDTMTADDSMGMLPNGWNYSRDEDIYAVIWNEELAGWDLDWREERFEDIAEEFGAYKDSYINKYKNHSRGILLDEKGTVEVIGNIYESPNLVNLLKDI